MDTQSRFEKQPRVQGRTPKQHSNPVMLVLFGTLGSLILGLIPIAYVSVSSQTQPQNSVPLAAGEAGVWSAFAEKDGATGEPRQ